MGQDPAGGGRILVTGEALVDLVPRRRGEALYQAVLGGSPYNVAIGLGRLGASVAFAGRLSRDSNGERFLAALEREAVDLSYVVRSKRPSPLAFVSMASGGTGPRYAFYLESTAFDGKAPLPQDWPAGLVHLHIGSFSALAGKQGKAALAALKRARTHASTSFDPNIRPLVLPEREDVVELVEARVALSTIVKASEEDMNWLYPGRDPQEAMADWAQRGPKLAVLTRGAHGAKGYFGQSSVVLPAPAVKLVDTIGAGDSFTAALLAIMAEDRALGAAADPISRDHVYRWLDFSIRAAAITCTRKGADPPRRRELEPPADETLAPV
jgi:fructokinase